MRFTAGYAASTSITFSIVASAPTPLCRLYQETLGLTPFEITLIFAIYSLTMVAAFLTVARLSDFVGRKPMILEALVLNALALILFIEASASTMPMVARAVQEVATGIASATLGALLRRKRRGRSYFVLETTPRKAGALAAAHRQRDRVRLRAVQVLWRAGIDVRQGESVVLLGVNGAGKTTRRKVLLGLLQAWQGQVSLAATDVTRLRTHHRVRDGMAHMSELGVFPGLCIDENIRIGGRLSDRGALTGSLSGGQRKMAGIAKALAANPRLLVMDEPSAGLSPLFVAEVLSTLHRFRADGLSLLIAEQNVAFLDLADRVFTMEHGRIGFSGSVAGTPRRRCPQLRLFRGQLSASPS